MRARRDVRLGTIVIGAGFAGVAGALAGAGDYTLYVVALVTIQAIAILSLNLLMGEAGQVSLGQAAFVGVGAFGAGELAKWGAPFPVTILVAPILGAVVATIVGLPALRIRGLQVAATTLAFGVFAQNLLFARPWERGSGTALTVARPAAIAGGRAFLLIAVACLALVLVVDRAVRRSRIGRAFTAIREREDTAAARGIAVGRTKLLAYAISGAYAGLAGALMAYLLERVTADSFTVFGSLGMVAAVVVGGLGWWEGAVVAGVTFAGLPELLRSSARVAPLIGAVLLMVVPLMRPGGLGSLLERRVPLPLPRRRARPRVAPAIGAVRRALSLSMPVRTLVRADDVAVSFGGVVALQGVSVEVRRGEIVGLIGPNGAGKSTFFNALSGMVELDRGSITYRGRELLAAPPSARAELGIARTFQQVGLCVSRTVRENVLIALHEQARYPVAAAVVRAPLVRRTERALEARADAALELLGLRDVSDARVSGLPHGMQRLAEVAATVATEPDLLLLDEPFAGLGHEESDALAQRLHDLRRDRGITMIVIEHDVPLVARLCDRLYVFDRGRVLAHGDPAGVQRDPAVVSVYIGEPVEEKVAAHG